MPRERSAIHSRIVRSLKHRCGRRWRCRMNRWVTRASRCRMREGKFDESESLYREALDKRRRLLGNKHPQTLVSISDMGTLLRERDKLNEAEPFMREAVETYRQVLGEDHPSTLIAMNNLAE